jgi:hypothetical protein
MWLIRTLPGTFFAGKYSSEEVVKSLGKLVSMEILQETGNGYYFPVNLLRKWIALRFPLRKLKEEI